MNKEKCKRALKFVENQKIIGKVLRGELPWSELRKHGIKSTAPI